MVGLPHDLQYCFDYMSELHEITGDVYSYFFSIKEDAVNFLDNNGMGKELLFKEYEKWRNDSSTNPVTKACLTFDGLLSLGYQFNDFLMGVTNKSILIRNGKKPRKQDAIDVLNGTDRDIPELRWIGNMRRIMAQCQADFSAVSCEDVRKSQLAHAKKVADFYALEFQMVDRILPVSGKRKIENRKRERKRRKTITKSVALLNNFVDQTDMKLFLGKDFVSITGTEFIFKVKARHIDDAQLQIKVHDKNDEYLAELCFYYQNMPIADQMTAMILDIHSGNEMDILKTANYLKVSEKFYRNNTLQSIINDKKKIEPLRPGLENAIENHLEHILPGSRNIHKYHDYFKPIARKVIITHFKKELKYFQDLCMKIDNTKPFLIGN